METLTALRNRVNRVTHRWFGDFPCNLLLLHRLKCKLFPGFTHKTSVNNLALHRMFIYHLHPHDIWRQQAISFSTDSWDMKYSTIYNSVSFLVRPKFCPAVLWESCENRNGGVEGGLLLLAACTDGPLLLVKQARQGMSQPTECAGNWPTELGRNP